MSRLSSRLVAPPSATATETSADLDPAASVLTAVEARRADHRAVVGEDSERFARFKSVGEVPLEHLPAVTVSRGCCAQTSGSRATSESA